MTLVELVTRYPHRFHPQTWYAGHAFALRDVSGPVAAPPVRIARRGRIPNGHAGPLAYPAATTLAQAFLAVPDHPIWACYFWCDDMDDIGQRVFVGGVTAENGHRFEIHRHLAITAQWGVPLWT